MPILKQDGVTVWESLAICEYLADRFPATVGRRGSIRFAATPKGFTGLGLRFSPFTTFTSFRLLMSEDMQ